MSERLLLEHRRTGRTTRMLEWVKREVLAGRYVFVICANKAETGRLAHQFADMLGENVKVVKAATGGAKVYPDNARGEASFETPATVCFDWRAQRVQGSSGTCLTAVDHLAVEQEYEYVLRMLDRWSGQRAPEAPE